VIGQVDNACIAESRTGITHDVQITMTSTCCVTPSSLVKAIPHCIDARRAFLVR
jgi:hypothetical protein